MSNMINDQIIDNIISDVADMDKVQVMNALSPANLKICVDKWGLHCRFCKRYFNVSNVGRCSR